MASCQHCGEDLPIQPRYAIEDDELDEVVAHIRGREESYIASETLYYCDPDCLVAAYGGDD